jgi:hypothetical protein
MASRSSSSSEGDKEVTQEASTESQKDAPFYCPGCGKRGGYAQQCTGKPESPHPVIEMVSTDELSGDPENFTKAPDTTNLG